MRTCTGTRKGIWHTARHTLETLVYEEGSEHVAASCRTSTCVREVPGSNICKNTFSEDRFFGAFLISARHIR